MKMSSNFERTDALVDDQELWMCVGKREGNVVPANAMKAWELYLHQFFTLTLDGGRWSASRPGRFLPGERAPGTHSLCVRMVVIYLAFQKNNFKWLN